MAVYINTLNGGSITIGSGGSPAPAPSGHADTRFTLDGGTVESKNISGTLDQTWMANNGYFDDDDGEWLKTITQADIGNTVTSIGDSAFYGCTELMSVTIPNGVTDIGENAFRGCSILPSVTIPGSVTNIWDYAFDGCTNLTTITVLGKTTAQAQTLLAYAEVPEGCTIVGELG